jgi:ABC-type enterobactin transport system permease subunit
MAVVVAEAAALVAIPRFPTLLDLGAEAAARRGLNHKRSWLTSIIVSTSLSEQAAARELVERSRRPVVQAATAQRRI